MARADRRLPALALTLGAILTLGALLSLLPVDRAPPPAVASPAPTAAAEGDAPPEAAARHAREARAREIDARFQQGIAMLHAGRFDDAATALHRLLELAPTMPEAHVNMGFAMLGLAEHALARDFFRSAIELRASQHNAYYGLALALAELGELSEALASMRVYAHLSGSEDPYLEKAQSMMWQWQDQVREAARDAAAEGDTDGTRPPAERG